MALLLFPYSFHSLFFFSNTHMLPNVFFMHLFDSIISVRMD